MIEIKRGKKQDAASKSVYVGPINIPEHKSKVKSLGNINTSNTSSICCFSFQTLNVTICSDTAYGPV